MNPIRFTFKFFSKKTIIFRFLVLITGIGCLSCASWIGPNRLETTRITVPASQWKGTDKKFRIAVASDLHLLLHDHAKLKRVVDTILREQPDAILLVGDYVKAHALDHSMPLSQISEDLAPLGSSTHCFAVLGNHDQDKIEKE